MAFVPRVRRAVEEPRARFCRIQAAAAKHAVVAEVKAGPDGKPLSRVEVVENLNPNDPAAGTEIEVVNLPAATMFAGEGPYLLLLNAEPIWMANPGEGPQPKSFTIVGQQRSPGNDLSGVGPPLIYPGTTGSGRTIRETTKTESSEPRSLDCVSRSVTSEECVQGTRRVMARGAARLAVPASRDVCRNFR